MKRIIALISVTVLMVTMMAAPASAALVNANVLLIDVVDVEGNTVQVPVSVAAVLCDTTVQALVDDAEDGDTQCEADADSQATNSFRGLQNL